MKRSDPQPRRRPNLKEQREAWLLTKDKILAGLGVAVTVAEFVWAEVLEHGLRYEWLVFAAALFGLAIMSGMDKRDRGG